MTLSDAPHTTRPNASGPAASPFSRYAPAYDREHAANPIARWTRRRNLAMLEKTFPPSSRVLELGCGTGEEAIHLARRGLSVLATDAALGMISVLETKLAPGGDAHDVAERIETRVLPASRAGTLQWEFAAAFDGAYSSFGPLNCEPDLERVLNGLAPLVKPGGRVVISLLTRYCLWETAWYLLHGDVRRAFRRWGGRARATVRDRWQEVRVPIFYWSTHQVRQMARRGFAVEKQMALPWLLPPQYLDGLVRRFPRLFKVLARVDQSLASMWPFYALGDHYLIVLVRRPD